MPLRPLRSLRTPVRLAVAAATVLAATVVATPSPVSALDACAPTPDMLASAPVRQFAVPGGAYARVWDTGTLPDVLQERRLAAVRIPAGSLTPTVVTAPTVSQTARPSSMVAADARAVVAINGGTFDVSARGIPDRVQIAHGRVRKLIRQTDANGYFGGIVVDSSSKTIRSGAFDVDGGFTTPAGTAVVGAVNWQWLATEGVSVYTRSWGANAAHPAGPRTVVVRGGAVVRILGSTATGRPGLWESWVTAPAGTEAAALLAQAKVGQRATVRWSAVGTYRYEGQPAGAFSRPIGATGSGGAIVKDGVNVAPCTSRDELSRARSVLVWDKDGNMLVVAVAGRTRFQGGLSVHQFADLLVQLGAVTAIRLDGGGSTALWVRKTVGGPLIRLDRPGTAYEPSVVDAVAFRAL